MSCIDLVSSHWLIFVAYTISVGFIATLLTLIVIGEKRSRDLRVTIAEWEDVHKAMSGGEK